jgi:hypothetical protein
MKADRPATFVGDSMAAAVGGGGGRAVSVREKRPGEARHTTRRRGGSRWEGVGGWAGGGQRREEAVAGRRRSRAVEVCLAGGGQVLSEALWKVADGYGWDEPGLPGVPVGASGCQWVPVPGASAE